jgi:hypothetical protein
MLDIKVLNQLVYDAFTGKITWLEASRMYPVDEYIDAFYRTRATMQRTIDDLTDEQVAYATTTNPIWSISETVTHLIYSQNGYHNSLMDMSVLYMPHLSEAARGFGEGAQPNKPAIDLRTALREATERIKIAIQTTQPKHDPKIVAPNPLFGNVNYPTLILLMYGHESDHVRQAILMRRLSRNFTDKQVALPSATQQMKLAANEPEISQKEDKPEVSEIADVAKFN